MVQELLPRLDGEQIDPVGPGHTSSLAGKAPATPVIFDSSRCPAVAVAIYRPDSSRSGSGTAVCCRAFSSGARSLPRRDRVFRRPGSGPATGRLGIAADSQADRLGRVVRRGAAVPAGSGARGRNQTADWQRPQPIGSVSSLAIARGIELSIESASEDEWLNPPEVNRPLIERVKATGIEVLWPEPDEQA